MARREGSTRDRSGSTGRAGGTGVSRFGLGGLVGGTGSARTGSARTGSARTGSGGGWLRAGFAGLTTRGRSFLAAGVAAGICAVLLGQRDLLRVGVLLVALPVACAVMMGRARVRLSLVRTVTPSRVVAGESTRVRVELRNLARAVTQVLLAEDAVPYALGPSPRFVLSRLPGGRRAAVTYTLRGQVRGHFDIGPLQLHLGDPFGMCEVTRSFTATDPMVVVPRTWPLAGGPTGGQWGGTGEALQGMAAASGEHDVAIREYRQGDDLRRVHWRSTARRGELMVRRDEQPRQMRASVLLDARAGAHRGDGPTSSFEWAVSMVASAAAHLSARRYAVRLLVEDSPTAWTSPSGGSGAGALLDRLAGVRLQSDDELAALTAALHRSHGDGVVVAVLGEVSEELARALAASRRPGTGALAVLLRVEDWAGYGAEQSAEQRRRVAGLLRTAGWGVAEAGPGDTPTMAWARASAGLGPNGGQPGRLAGVAR